MRSFFVQMFLAFWISTLGIFWVVMAVFPRKDFVSWENMFSALEASTAELGRMKIALAQRHLCGSGVASARILVLDSLGADVCGDAVPAPVKDIALRARAKGKPEFGRLAGKWIVAHRVYSPSGQAFVMAFKAPFQEPSLLPHLPPSALPVSALVTFVFAYLLTNPVRALRRAFRRFASGDMSVRLPVVRNAVRDWGGADIRTLMIDFNEMADRIQALLEAHKILLRDVSHELRSPLARLNVALELAREDSGESTSALDRAELESSRLNTLIGELLSLSRMEATQDLSISQSVNLGQLVDDLMPDLLFEAEARGCSLQHERQAEVEIAGNEEILRRALENVLRNAIRYSPAQGSVQIQTCSEQRSAVVRICDRGPGVPEESLQSIFRPFHRVDTARQASTGGFGVGLAIADRAVMLHHGTIQARNRQGGGLCVEIRLRAA